MLLPGTGRVREGPVLYSGKRIRIERSNEPADERVIEDVAAPRVNHAEIAIRPIDPEITNIVVLVGSAIPGNEEPDVGVAGHPILGDDRSVGLKDENRRGREVRCSEPLIAGNLIVADQAERAESQLHAVGSQVLLSGARTEPVVLDHHVDITVGDNPGFLVFVDHVVGNPH